MLIHLRLLAVLIVLALGAPLIAGRQPAARAYRILLTNDDGVRAPGLLALADALKTLGDVTIVAPLENQSGKGHSISITDPVYADTVALPGNWNATALTATPASCVKIGLAAVMRARPDLVVSGINRGYNLGFAAYISGTVGAAREAALQGIPAIASSMSSVGHPDYAAAARMTRQVADRVQANGLAPGLFLNVNVPSGPIEAVKGIRLTTQSRTIGMERFEERRTPSGRRYFWNIYEDEKDDREGTDVWATTRGFVAVTPLRAGEFDAKAFETLRSRFP